MQPHQCWLSHPRPREVYTRGHFGGKTPLPPVYVCAGRISDVLQSVPLMRRAVRGTETRYLAVVGTHEHGLGNVPEID